MMRYLDVSEPLAKLAYDYFFWFSRFEFALKENRYLKSTKPGARADPGWAAFVKAKEAGYMLSDAGAALIKLAPQKQIVTESGLGFQAITFEDTDSDLAKVVRFLQTIRNNLFHGGKHGSTYWDDPERMKALLIAARAALIDLGKQSGLSHDVERQY